MAKKVKTLIKLQIPAGQANPAPPVGPALGQHGLNIQEFCTKFNAGTQDKKGDIIPVEITVYEDRSYDFILKTPPTAELIKKAAGLKKGSGKPLTEKVGKITRKQAEEIATIKMPDLNANNLDAAVKIVAGTARQMGVTVEQVFVGVVAARIVIRCGYTAYIEVPQPGKYDTIPINHTHTGGDTDTDQLINNVGAEKRYNHEGKNNEKIR